MPRRPRPLPPVRQDVFLAPALRPVQHPHRILLERRAVDHGQRLPRRFDRHAPPERAREELGVAERRGGRIGGAKGHGAGVFAVEHEDVHRRQWLRRAGGDELLGARAVEEDLVEGHRGLGQVPSPLLG